MNRHLWSCLQRLWAIVVFILTSSRRCAHSLVHPLITRLPLPVCVCVFSKIQFCKYINNVMLTECILWTQLRMLLQHGHTRHLDSMRNCWKLVQPKHDQKWKDGPIYYLERRSGGPGAMVWILGDCLDAVPGLGEARHCHPCPIQHIFHPTRKANCKPPLAPLFFFLLFFLFGVMFPRGGSCHHENSTTPCII